MTFEFDSSLDRRASGAEKWDKDVLARLFGRSDVLPLWVADMDFGAPEAVQDFLAARAGRGDHGYDVEPPRLRATVAEWLRTRHDWGIDPDHLTAVPGVISALGAAVQLLTEPGDGVIIQPPVFFYFASTIRKNDRRVVSNPIRLVDGRYEIDFEDLEAKAADPKTKLLMLCSPHNPVARVWTRAELERVAEICARHDVRVVADEIHGDIIYANHAFVSVAAVDPAAVIAFSPAKTFNVAGITGGFAHIADDAIRMRFREHLGRIGLPKANALIQGVTEAVYRDGGPWLDALLKYLGDNVEYARNRLDSIPGVTLVEPDGTYLLWLDFRELGLDRKALRSFLVERARLGLNAGSSFGREGAGFARMCIACPRSTLNEAFDRLEAACR